MNVTITNTPNGVKTEIVTSLAKSATGGILVNSDGLGKELIKDEFIKAVDGGGSSSSSSIMNATNFNEIHDDVKEDGARYVSRESFFWLISSRIDSQDKSNRRPSVLFVETNQVVHHIPFLIYLVPNQ